MVTQGGIAAGYIFAGSLVGIHNFAGGNTLNRCFAAGDVIVQRSTDDITYAGGLAGGTFSNNTIQNSVALCKSVSVYGISLPGNTYDRTFCRILGSTLATPTLTDNYAYIDMKLYHKANVDDRETTTIPVTDIGNATNHQDGKDANLGTFRTTSFWQNDDNSANRRLFLSFQQWRSVTDTKFS